VVVPEAGPTPAAPKKLFSLKDDRLRQAPGLAKSAQHNGIYWTANSTGGTARVFGIDSSGKVKAELSFTADLKDVEAVGVGHDGTIYLADIGDNEANRDMVEIYMIPEPAQLEDSDNVKYHQFDFTYPDGAHDAETLLIEPGTDQLFIVTKTSKGAGGIYAAPAAPSRGGTNELTKLAAAPAGVITDGTFLPDGQHVVLRTTTGLVTVQWGEAPTAIATAALSFGQGGTVAVGPAANSVVAGSEGASAALYQVAVPAKAAASSPPAGTPTAKPTTAAADATDDSGKSHNLRWILIGAAAFALLITILTFPPGRRERLDRMAENARLTGQSPPTTHRRHQN
jgi:hypothetical protein